MAPEVPHAGSVKVIFFFFFPLVPSFLSHTNTKTFYFPPSESDGDGEISSEDEGDVQVSQIGDW